MRIGNGTALAVDSGGPPQIPIAVGSTQVFVFRYSVALLVPLFVIRLRTDAGGIIPDVA